MLLDHGDKFERLIAQPWFADELEAGERAFITSLSNSTGIDALYGDLLASPPAAPVEDHFPALGRRGHPLDVPQR